MVVIRKGQGKGKAQPQRPMQRPVIKAQVKREQPAQSQGSSGGKLPFWQKKAIVERPASVKPVNSRGSVRTPPMRGGSKGSGSIRPMASRTQGSGKGFGNKGGKSSGKGNPGPGRWVHVSELKHQGGIGKFARSTVQRTGKGKGKGKDKGKTKSKPRTVPKDFKFDGEARYTGKVGGFWKHKGYGFIEPDEKGIVPDDKIFVYWKDIKTDDRFPFLNKDQEVEFSIKNRKEYGGKKSIRAKEVTLPGGSSVTLQDEADSKKEFVGDQMARYTGTLKFFSPMNGFGYIKVDADQGIPDDVPEELRVETSEVNTGNTAKKQMSNVQVEFGIWITKKGRHRAYNMTLPGGETILVEKTENRKEEETGQEYEGTVEKWHFKFGWGFILPKKGTQLPGKVKSKIAQMNKDTKKKGKEVTHTGVLYFRRADILGDFRPQQGDKVFFQVYTDDKGAGACNVHD